MPGLGPALAGGAFVSRAGDRITGNLAVADTATLEGGVKVGAGNRIGHLETGNWTPAVTDGNGNSVAAYQSRSGRFVRLGDQVRASFKVIVDDPSPLDAGALLRVTGLPYVIATAASESLATWLDLASPPSGFVGLRLWPDGGTDSVAAYGLINDGTSDIATTDLMQAGARLSAEVIYDV